MGQQKPVILDGGTFKDLPSGDQLEVNAGTAALPAITFGDADTGLLSSGTNEVAISTNGAQRVVVDATGDVGIGTASPAQQLEVAANAAGGVLISGSVADRRSLEISNTTAGAGGSSVILRNTSARYLDLSYTSYNSLASGAILASQTYLLTAGPGGLLLGAFNAGDGVGDVVIVQGGASTSNERLRVSAGEVVVNDAVQAVNFRVEGQSDANLLFTNASTNYVGIGNNSPAAKLDVRGVPVVDGDNRSIFNALDPTALAANTGAGIALGGVYTSGGSYAAWAGVVSRKDNAADGDYAGSLTFITRANGSSPTERMRITSAGNVGIGTASPSHTLHASTAGNTEIVSTTTNNSNYGQLAASSPSSVWVMRANGSGVGTTFMGTSDASWITMQNIGGDGFKIGAVDAGDQIQFGSYEATISTTDVRVAITDSSIVFNGTKRNYDFRVAGDNEDNVLVVDASADNVGIGTAGPGYRLTVEKGGADVFAASSTSALGAGQGTAWFLADAGADAKAAQIVVANSGSLGEPSRIAFRDSTAAITHSAISAERPDPAGGGEVSFSTTPAGDGAMTERMRITSAGNVGIGTASPTARIHAYSSASAAPIALFETPNTTDNDSLQLTAGTDVCELFHSGATNGFLIGSAQGDNGIRVTSNKKFLIGQAGSPYAAFFTVDTSNGNVGIGTTTPSARVHAYSSASAIPIALFETLNTTDNDSLRLAAGTDVFDLFHAGTAGGFLTGTSQGDNGIRITSGKKFLIGEAGSPNATYFTVNTANGNVGIGTTSPATALDVVGVITASTGVVAPIQISASASTAYTLALTDASKLLEFSSGSAVTVTVPANSTVAFPVGTQIVLTRTGSGTVTLAGAVGVTVNFRTGLGLNLNGQWAVATLVKRATDTWLLFGDLA